MNGVKQVISKKPTVYTFGESNKCRVTINRNQVWDVFQEPNEYYKLYALTRHSVLIEIVPEDYEKFFMEVVDDD